MEKMKSTVSIVLPVYNAEKYVREAIESILNQTFTDYEFVIINDGSTDGSEKIIQSFKDKRIIYVKNEKNIGIVKTLNKGIEKAFGTYIVRMDADDVSVSDRVEKQVKFMDENPRISISGSWMKYFGSKDEDVKFPTSESDVSNKMIFLTKSPHPL